MKEIVNQANLVQALEGLFNFQDGYTFEEGLNLTSTLNQILRDRYHLPLHLILDWEPGESQLFVLTPDAVEGHYRAKEITMPYVTDESEGYPGSVRAFVDELLLLI